MNYPHRRGQLEGGDTAAAECCKRAAGASMRSTVTGGWTLMKKDIPPTIAGAGGSSARRRAEPEQERAPKKAGETREKIEFSAEQRARFRSISHRRARQRPGWWTGDRRCRHLGGPEQSKLAG